MKRILSVSLGSSKRDKSSKIELLGESFLIERVGTDGDRKKFTKLFAQHDGKVDAFGIGGADLFVAVGHKKYRFREVAGLIKPAKKSPCVDGSGLKHTLERRAVQTLQHEGVIDFSKEKVLLVSAVDRYGMAQSLAEISAPTLYGDLLFGLGLPIPVRSYRTVKILGSLLLPIVTNLPIQWFYPTGAKQEQRSPRFERYFQEATIIAGDWHYIKRYAPCKLPQKTVLTQTVRKADLEWLAGAGVKRVITTTPLIEGETFATNVMEAVLIAHFGLPPEQVTEAHYLEALEKLDWKPNILDLI